MKIGIKYKLMWITFIFIFIIYGCTSAKLYQGHHGWDWYCMIEEILDPGIPVFYFSYDGKYTDKRVHMGWIQIAEVDDNGDYIRPVWVISAETNSLVNRVFYGIPPDGYYEFIKAEPLQMNRWYKINATYSFMIINDSGKLRALFYR